MKNVARFFSLVLHPLLMPFYGMVLFFTISYLVIYPFKIRALLALSVLFFTYVLPAVSIFILYRMKIISSINLNNRSERFWPYLICLICYIACGFVLYKAKLPLWVLGYMAGGVASILINTLITFKWKISAHLTGMGGILGAAFALCQMQFMFPVGLIALLILLTGVLGTSRVLMGRHTLMQVLAGTLNGFVCIYLGMMLAVL